MEVFARYHEKDIRNKRSPMYGEESELTKNIIAHDANSLYLHCLGDVMLCGKDALVLNEKPFDQK